MSHALRRQCTPLHLDRVGRGRPCKPVAQLGHVKGKHGGARHYAVIRMAYGPMRRSFSEAELDLSHVRQAAVSVEEACIMLRNLAKLKAEPPSTGVLMSTTDSRPEGEGIPMTWLEPPELAKDESVVTPTKPHGTSEPSSAEKFANISARAIAKT